MWEKVLITGVLALIAAANANAKVAAGIGMSQAFGGRQIPGFHLAVESPHHALTLLASGVETQSYFHSAYSLKFFWTWEVGELPIGSIRAGFGPGAYLSFRGYREDVSFHAPTRTDLAIGPAAQIRWAIWGPAFLSLEATLGIRFWSFTALNFQQLGNVALGVRF